MKYLALLFWLLFPASILAQSFNAASPVPYESDLLQARPVRWYLGVSAGLYGFHHLGSYSPNCACELSDQCGLRVFPGLELSVHFPKRNYAFALQIWYDDNSADFSSSFSAYRTVSGDKPDTLLNLKRTSNVVLRSIHVVPRIAWYPGGKKFFMTAGLDVAIPLKSRYNHVEHMLTPGFVYEESGTNETVLLPETDIPGGSSIKCGVMLGAGIDIFLSDVLVLAPQASIVYPISSVSSKDKDWRVLTEQLVVFLKFRL
jgi:hypothetical protein